MSRELAGQGGRVGQDTAGMGSISREIPYYAVGCSDVDGGGGVSLSPVPPVLFPSTTAGVQARTGVMGSIVEVRFWLGSWRCGSGLNRGAVTSGVTKPGRRAR